MGLSELPNIKFKQDYVIKSKRKLILKQNTENIKVTLNIGLRVSPRQYTQNRNTKYFIETKGPRR